MAVATGIRINSAWTLGERVGSFLALRSWDVAKRGEAVQRILQKKLNSHSSFWVRQPDLFEKGAPKASSRVRVMQDTYPVMSVSMERRGRPCITKFDRVQGDDKLHLDALAREAASEIRKQGLYFRKIPLSEKP